MLCRKFRRRKIYQDAWTDCEPVAFSRMETICDMAGSDTIRHLNYVLYMLFINVHRYILYKFVFIHINLCILYKILYIGFGILLLQ